MNVSKIIYSFYLIIIDCNESEKKCFEQEKK